MNERKSFEKSKDRLEEERQAEKTSQKAKLKESDLSGAHLIEANLQEADLRKANLQRAAFLGGGEEPAAEATDDVAFELDTASQGEEGYET